MFDTGSAAASYALSDRQILKEHNSISRLAPEEPIVMPPEAPNAAVMPSNLQSTNRNLLNAGFWRKQFHGSQAKKVSLLQQVLRGDLSISAASRHAKREDWEMWTKEFMKERVKQRKIENL